MTKQDFLDWKRHPVTQSLFTALINRIQEGREELGDTAGIDPLADRFKVGVIRGHQDVLEGLDNSFVENDTDDSAI